MKRMWVTGVLALLVAGVAATPTGATAGGNSANAKLCQEEGWKTLYRGDGSTFAGQGDCVSYGAKGNTILTEPTNPWKAACEQNGGTFSIGNTHIGNPLDLLTPPAYAYECVGVTVTETFWHFVLTPLCFGFPDAEVSEFTLTSGIGNGNCIRKGTV